MDFLASPQFWTALSQIVIIDILLGGDNAVVIALACRNLPPAQRKMGILYGTAGAVILRVMLVVFALQLLAIPFLKLVGAILLVWIGLKLMLPQDDGGHEVSGSDRLWGAVKTVIIADLVMSVDNVIGIAGAAQGAGEHQTLLVVLGLLISVPIIIWGSQFVIKLMDRFPVVIVVGAMLLGWIAGQMAYTDPGLAKWATFGKVGEYCAAAAGAVLVFLVGKWMAARAAHAKAQ